MTDALGRATDYFYDVMNRLTTVESPSGSATVMTMAYDQRGLMTAHTDFEGKTTTFQYDWPGRLIRQTDQVGVRIQLGVGKK